MRPRTPLCGNRKLHGPHNLMHMRGDTGHCNGVSEQEAAATALWLLLHQYVADHTLYGLVQLPEGITLLMHPSVRYDLAQVMEPDIAGMLARQDPLDGPLPAEIPVMITTALRKGEWRLVTISPVNGGVMPE